MFKEIVYVELFINFFVNGNCFSYWYNVVNNNLVNVVVNYGVFIGDKYFFN